MEKRKFKSVLLILCQITKTEVGKILMEPSLFRGLW
jgi:hypothetical protein